VEQWIAEGRRGNRSALNQLFGACLPYLRRAARQDLGAALRSRLDASDVVQETLIEAYRDFPQFHGQTEKDLLAWLRQILHNNLASERRRHIATAMRSIRCEVHLTETALDQLADADSSARVCRGGWARAEERSEGLERALGQLPEHYRQVLILRNWEELTFSQVGTRLHCSAEAARKLWGRAVEELAFVLGAQA
jgi:RNA polymerase sigma-70 factor (ECF subfamily)